METRIKATTVKVPTMAIKKDIEAGKLEVRLPLHLVEMNEHLKESIEQKGILVPVNIRIRDDMTRILWDGLHRVNIAIELDLASIPVTFCNM